MNIRIFSELESTRRYTATPLSGSVTEVVRPAGFDQGLGALTAGGS